MSFWNVAKKVGSVALDVGVALGKEAIKQTQENKKIIDSHKTMSSDELQEKVNDDGFFSKSSAEEKRFAEAELNKRNKG